jgi:hypothetical protein
VSLPSSYRSRRGHIHLLRVLPLVGCRSKTLTVGFSKRRIVGDGRRWWRLMGSKGFGFCWGPTIASDHCEYIVVRAPASGLGLGTDRGVVADEVVATTQNYPDLVALVVPRRRGTVADA